MKKLWIAAVMATSVLAASAQTRTDIAVLLSNPADVAIINLVKQLPHTEANETAYGTQLSNQNAAEAGKLSFKDVPLHTISLTVKEHKVCYAEMSFEPQYMPKTARREAFLKALKPKTQAFDKIYAYFQQAYGTPAESDNESIYMRDHFWKTKTWNLGVGYSIPDPDENGYEIRTEVVFMDPAMANEAATQPAAPKDYESCLAYVKQYGDIPYSRTSPAGIEENASIFANEPDEAKAMLYMGYLSEYADDNGMKAKAMDWYIKAGEKGSVTAMLVLADQFQAEDYPGQLPNRLVQPDKQKEKYWLTQASAKGSAEAKARLKTLK